jgi:hypothetical protein
MKRLLFVLSLFSTNLVAQEKTAVAKVEPVHVKESNVLWTAAVSDTLEYCVINANSVAVMNASFPKEKNITRQISFKVRNKDGEGRTINSTVTGVTDWNGSKHYVVQLEVGMNFQTRKVYRKVDCVLADLESVPYKLYVGKHWLGDDMEVK